jgi:hypothetical protein
MAFNFTSANSQYLTTASTPVSAYPITLACWFRSNLAASTCAVSINAVTTQSRINMFILNTGAVNLGVSSTGNAASATTTTTATANTWNHAVGVCASSTSRTVYLNGGGDATNTTSVDISGFSQIAVGARHAGSWGGFYNGDIAEVGIWNAALTAAEIASLSKGFTPDQIRPQNLVFYAPLVRDLQDARGGLAITNNNSATVANHPRVYD